MTIQTQMNIIPCDKLPMPAPMALVASSQYISRAAIDIRTVGIAYGRRQVVENVSLIIPERRITALIGPSGCGKTSLLMALNRLIDLCPGSRVTGEIIIDGHDVLRRGANVRALRRKVGMVFQKPNPFPFSIRRNFDLVLDEAGISGRVDRLRLTEECLMGVGLFEEVRDRLHQPALSLSGGQQQRLCIARALVTSPQILLLDEPCSALDPISTHRIEELLVTLRQSITIVIVTHNLAQARRISDNCALFWTEHGQGHLLESSETAEIFQSPQSPVTRAYVNGAIA